MTLYSVDDDNTNCETLWINIKAVGGCVKFGVCYRSPKADQDEINSLFEEIKTHSKGDTIIMGDFNYKDINWKTGFSSGAASNFMDLVKECFLYQHVEEPTRENNILDLVLSTEQDLVQEVVIESPVANSDHNVITFVVPLKIKMESRTGKIYNYHKADFLKICSKLELVTWNQNIDSNRQWNFLKGQLLNVREEYVPIRKPRRGKSAPWMTISIRKGIRKREKIWKKFVQSPTYRNRTAYTKKRNELCTAIRKAKFNFECKLAENIKDDPKSFYAYVKSKSRARIGIGPLKDENNLLIEDEKGMTRILNNYFASVFTSEDLNNIPVPESMLDENDKLSDITITAERVNKAIDDMKLNKAAGPDELTSTYIKGLKGVINEPLIDLFKTTMEEGSIPNDWRCANVTAIFKKGLRTDPGNYRPVSLTSNICKVMERMIKEDIVNFLERKQIIRNSQHGFRNKKSCLTNLLEFMEHVSQKLDKGEPVDIIYLDFQKAFDKVPHKRLLAKLKAIGIEGNLLRWIGLWLTGRKQRVVINSVESDWKDVLSGVPQGSILGPLLFIIFINDIDLNIGNKILKFADDTKLFGSASSDDDIESLRYDLNRLFEWSEKWQMKFNVEKCVVMHVGAKNVKAQYDIGGKSLTKVEEEKDLGVIFNKDFKVASQCIKAANKGNQILGLINRTIVCKQKIVILNLYKSLVRPHIEYCIQAWRPHLVKDIEVLERVQRRATRMINECKGRTYEERLRITGLTNLETRRTRADMIEVWKIMTGKEGIDERDFFTRHQGITRGHTKKLCKSNYRKDVLKFSFGNRVVNMWNKLPEDVISRDNLNEFKSRIDKFLRDNGGIL
jgi:hypothetical protein